MQDFNNPTHLIVSSKRLSDCFINSESGALQDYKVITQIKLWSVTRVNCVH